jgi:hypothetical protein
MRIYYSLRRKFLKYAANKLGYVLISVQQYQRHLNLENEYCALMQKLEPIERDGEGSNYALTQENEKLKEQIITLKLARRK